MEALTKTLPAGYHIVVGGTVEESKKSQASVIAVVPVMLLIMLTVLMVQLQSFQRLFLVLSVAPLGLIGVVAALLLSGRPLGFVAILGILALLGMITKNAVILIGQIEAERSQGKNVWEAAIDASSSRFRPIMLTAVSTVLGMIPIAPTVFWGPMAFAIMGGLLVATILTLIFLPTLYVAWFRGTEGSSDPSSIRHSKGRCWIEQYGGQSGHELIGGAKPARGAARERSRHSWECDFPRCRIFWFLAGADRRRCWRSCGRVGCCCCGNLGKSAPDAGAAMEPASRSSSPNSCCTFCVNRSLPG